MLNPTSKTRSVLRDIALSIGSRLPLLDPAVRMLLRSRLLREFYEPVIGAEYGFDRVRKKEFLDRLRAIASNVDSATDRFEWLVLATRVLEIPRSAKGVIVECGCYKGASTCLLSLICAVVGRKLIACDSFSGLPLDSAHAAHRYVHLGGTTTYTPGAFAGALDEVKRNISEWGDIGVCEFLPGLFAETLEKLREPVAFAFIDVDLASSMADCIRHLWPLLIDGGYVYTDDSCDMDVVSLWFDRRFWEAIGSDPPGYVGSGTGLCGLSADYSSLGYARKFASRSDHLKPLQFWRSADRSLSSRDGAPHPS